VKNNFGRLYYLLNIVKKQFKKHHHLVCFHPRWWFLIITNRHYIRMKQLIFSFLLIAGLGLTSNVQAQDKLAYVNTAELIQAMPEYKAAEKQIEDYGKQKQAQIEQRYQKLQQDAAVLEEKIAAGTITQLEAQQQQQVLLQEEQAIQQAYTMAEREMGNKQQQLMLPIEEKLLAIIKTVADELGYNYVLNAATGVLLSYPPESDITEQVKARLM